MLEVGKLKKVKFITNSDEVIDVTYKRNKEKIKNIKNIKEILCIFKNAYDELEEIKIKNKKQIEAFIEYLKENNYKINHLIIEQIL